MIKNIFLIAVLFEIVSVPIWIFIADRVIDIYFKRKREHVAVLFKAAGQYLQNLTKEADGKNENSESVPENDGEIH